MKKQLVISIILLLSTSFEAQSYVLTEKKLNELIQTRPPTVQQIEASFLATKVQDLANHDSLSFQLEGSGQSNKSDERLLNSFDGGVVQSSSIYSIGLSRPTKYGVALGVEAFSQKSSNTFISGAATSGIGFNLTFDLYQDFLGKKTRRSLEKSATALERAKLEKKINIKTFESNLRKLYWALVANAERTRLLTGIVDLAKKQYQEAVKRKRSGVADAGEVARYHSQWSSRKSNLLSQTYQRNEILKELKALLPDLNNKKVTLESYSVDETIKTVLVCAQKISSYEMTPVQYTPYDEIIKLLSQEESLENKITKTYDDASVKMVGSYYSVGRDFGMGNSQDNLFDDGKPRTSLGLQVSIPLGGKKKTTRDVILELNRKKYQAMARESLARINSYHSETASSIVVLGEVVKNQKDTNRYLLESIKNSRKKYLQARITVQDLITEQDAQLQSSLSVIDTNLRIINTMMDYFSVFPDFPCEFNKLLL